MAILISKKFGTTIMIISLITFITTWLFLRKHQWRLIKETWEKGKKLIQEIMLPISTLIESIWDSAKKIGESIQKQILYETD